MGVITSPHVECTMATVWLPPWPEPHLVTACAVHTRRDDAGWQEKDTGAAHTLNASTREST